MAWITTSHPIHNNFSSLFVPNGENITVNEDCLAILEEILRKLAAEDSNLRTFRRAIGFGQNIKKNLMPLLLHIKDDTKITDASKIIDTTIKILVNLTIPVEYLLPVEAMSRSEVEKHTIFELNNLLISSKELFTKGKNTKVLVDHMKFIVESDSQLNMEQCESINNCLLLLRNILHIPENKEPPSNGSLCNTTMQNQIMWNLFTQSIDKIIIYLMSCPQKVYWGVTVVQLIALMYKDQHIGTLQKLLNLWLEASYTDSSEDNESNTSPPEQGSDDFSPVITSDPTSDSSDNGSNERNKCNNNNNNTNNNNTRVIMERETMRGSQNRSKSINTMKRNKSMETEASSSGISSLGNSMECYDNSFSTNPSQQNQNSNGKRNSLTGQSNTSSGISSMGNSIECYENLLSPTIPPQQNLNCNMKRNSITSQSNTSNGISSMGNSIESYDNILSPTIPSQQNHNSNLKRNSLTGQSNTSSGISSMGNSIECYNSSPTIPSQQNQNSMKRNSLTGQSNTSSGISSVGIECYDNSSLTIPSQQNQNSHLKRTSLTGQSNQSEISDCGYVTQVENQESISTSSNEDDQPRKKPIHQKPPIFQKTRYITNKNRATTALDTKELRRKKLVKRRKTNKINMKGLIHHLPTDEDIANILKEFTVDFLLKGYGTLVNDLYTELLSYVHVDIDTSHFFWLVTYFLKFAIQLELDPEHISPVLSEDILNYLVFQGIWICEELEISWIKPGVDLKPCLRRLHLVVTAIREFLQAIEAYQKMIHLSDSDKDHLAKLQYQITKLKDLKLLFVLLLRQYNPNIQSRQYLQDLILTNHCFFLFLDNACTSQEQHLIMMDHLKNFATIEIMRQYGLLLADFKENGEFVNNCIFTMMHHIGGDLNDVETLFQPTILKTFSQIWETDYELCDDWSDLIEYVIHKFIHSPKAHSVEKSSTPDCDNISVESLSECSSLDEILILFRWTEEEKDNLRKYYNQSKEASDIIEKITEKYKESGFKFKSPISVIQELLDQNIITENEYHELLKHHRIERLDSLSEEDPPKQVVEDHFFPDNNLADSDTKVIKEYLYKENKGKFLLWLQDFLLENCYVKLVLKNPEEFRNTDTILEPSVYYFALSNLPTPLIPWTTEQAKILKHQPFILFLHKLGFYLPLDTGKAFVRIPNFWTPDYIFSIAQLIGPVDKDKLKFDVDKMKGVGVVEKTISDIKPIAASFFDTGKLALPDLKLTPSICRYTPFTNQLSIAIPETDLIAYHLPPPELAITGKSSTYRDNKSLDSISMDCLPAHRHDSDNDQSDQEEPDLMHHDNDMVLSDLERNSYCDTASVCVSDEEDKPEKVILALGDCDKIA